MFAQLIQDPQRVPQHVVNPATGAASEIDGFGQMTKLASSFGDVDGLFYFTYAVCIFFFVLILGALLYSVVVHRRKTYDQPPASNVTHNTPLEVVWTVIPLIIVMIMFAWGFKGSLDMTNVPSDARRYTAIAKQWSWTFKYPKSQAESDGEVWVEIGKPVEFLLQSIDVLHAFYLPSHRVKRDVIPGRYQSTWFLPTALGDYHLFCAEYCGQDHSRMYAKLHVVTAAEYAKKPWDTFDDSTPEATVKSGQALYNSKGCSSCHSLNGSALVGPTWKGIFTKNPDGTFVGRQTEVIEAGERKTITVDAAYIAESIAKPDQKKVVGFENVNMTPSELNERQLNAIIEFMKTLADN